MFFIPKRFCAIDTLKMTKILDSFMYYTYYAKIYLVPENIEFINKSVIISGKMSIRNETMMSHAG